MSFNVESDYYKLINTKPTQKHALTRKKLLVNLYNRTEGLNDFIEVVVGVKKWKLNQDEEDEEDDEELMTDTVPERFVDLNELEHLLHIYSKKGFLGVLELFGMTFANLKFPFKTEQIITDQNSIAYKIHQHNCTMKDGLMQYLSEFLTSFSIEYRKEFEYCTPDDVFLNFLEKQYECAQSTTSKLKRSLLTNQHEIMRTLAPSLFLPLFKLKNMIDSGTHLVEMSFQEYFAMIFKQFHIFSENTDGVHFKTSEALISDSLKLSLNIMNRKWIENTNRMQPDFVLVRELRDYTHYFVIGEFDKNKIEASTPEEFICSHKDTVKIILEGRSVLKDILYKFTTKRVNDHIKQQLVVRLFLADTSGKVVIIRMRPVFHQVQMGLHGVYYTLSFSKLLNIFEKEELFTFVSEIDASVSCACSLMYTIDENSSITSLCPTPMTLKSQSSIAKVFSIPTHQKRNVSLRCLKEDDEKHLIEFLAKEFPHLLVEKKEIIEVSDAIQNIKVFIELLVDRSFRLYTLSSCQVFGNPIYACYPIQRNDCCVVQTISLSNFSKIEDTYLYRYTEQPETDLDADGNNGNSRYIFPPSTHLRNSNHDPSTPNRANNTIQDVAFKRWGLSSVSNLLIHSRCNFFDFGVLKSYICYCEGMYIPTNTESFIKIHSAHCSETYNADAISRYVNERNNADNLDSKHTIHIFKYSLEDISVPYEVFGEINDPCKEYRTDITISEKLTSFNHSKLVELSANLDNNTKLLILLYIIDGCLRGTSYLLCVLKLLHNDIAIRNIMLRKRLDKSILSSLLVDYCHFDFTDDIVLTDMNNCRTYYGTKSELQNEMVDLALVLVELIHVIFSIENYTKQDSRMMDQLWTSFSKWKSFSFHQDFKLVHTWIIQLIESLMSIDKFGERQELQFENEHFKQAITSLNAIVELLLFSSTNSIGL